MLSPTINYLKVGRYCSSMLCYIHPCKLSHFIIVGVYVHETLCVHCGLHKDQSQCPLT